MKLQIDFTQASTKRGAVWLAVAIIGIPMAISGHDVNQLILLAAGVSGGLGVMEKD